MDDDLLALLLIALAATSGLNLFLILRLARIVVPQADAEPLVNVGARLPDSVAARLSRGPVSPDERAGKPIVLLFMSPACPACRSKIPELAEIFPTTQRLGIELWIIGADDEHPVSQLTDGTPLAGRTLSLDASEREILNPLNAAPLYIFIDDSMIIQAGDYVGDENWQTFVDQMHEAEAHPPETPSDLPHTSCDPSWDVAKSGATEDRPISQT